MNIEFAPSPLKVVSSADDHNSTDKIFFELEPLMYKTNNLFEAATTGQMKDIQTYLSTENNKADALDQNGYSDLHHAARMNRVLFIELKKTTDATIDLHSKDGFTPLHVAARSNALEALDALLKKGAKINHESKHSHCTTLHFAAQFGHRQIVERLLKERGLNIDATDRQGMTALHMAISRGYEEICNDLVKNKASVTMTMAKGETSLHLAAASSNTNIMSLIVQSAHRMQLRQPADAVRSAKEIPEFQQFVNQKDAAQNTALHIAVQAGSVAMCQVLTQHGADIDAQNMSLQTPLHVATIRKNKKILELLIKHGAQVHSKDFKGKTPLHRAATFGNAECIEILLRNFTAVDVKDANGLTPFLCGVAAGQTKCVELLLDSGADMTVRDNFQRSCIQLAVENEQEDVLRMLLEKSGSGLSNVPDVQQRTALHYAALSSNVRLLEILLQHKANCLIKDGTGKTPLHIAAEAGKVRHVEALTKASFSSVFQRDVDDRTPLHFAALNGKGKICSILMQMGAEVDSADAYGWTPLFFAAKNGSSGLIQMFLEKNANIDHGDRNGNTALLVASARGHVEAVKVLLDREASLNPGNDGLNCLDVAIENHQAGVVMAIIRNSRWKDILSAKSPDGENRMGKLIERYPDAARSVMDRCIQRSLAQRSISYDFRLLDPGPDDKSGPGDGPFFGLMDIVKHKQKDLLVHDLSRKLLKIKWHTYGWFVYWTNLTLFAFFLFLMTYFMLTQRKQIKLQKSNNPGDDVDDIFEKKDAFNRVSPFLILVFASLHLGKELYQMGVQRTGYFKQRTNLLEWALYLSTMIFILPYVSTNVSSLRGDPRVTWQIGTVAVFLGYMNLILFVQTLDHVGIYVTMFFQVAKTVLQAISFCSLFVLAFSVVFFILFKEQVFMGILHVVRCHREPRSGLFHKNNEELISNCPTPYPRGQDCFKQFPTPGTEILDLSWGLPGRGMVTGRIEPCIIVVVHAALVLLGRVVTGVGERAFKFEFSTCFCSSPIKITSVLFLSIIKKKTAFSSFDMAAMQVLKMTLGELDYNTMMVDSLNQMNPDTNAPLLPYRESSTIFMVIFIFAMSIILMNLLVGLAVGDIESVQKHAFLSNKGKIVNFVVGVERTFPKCITRRFHRPQVVVTGRRVAKKISSQDYTFEDVDVSQKDINQEKEDELRRLEELSKELTKAKQRQASIMKTMHDQGDLLLAIAARVGVDIPQDDAENAPRSATL